MSIQNDKNITLALMINRIYPFSYNRLGRIVKPLRLTAQQIKDAKRKRKRVERIRQRMFG